MARIHSNNFDTTLNGAITNSATTMTLTSVTGLPAIGAGVTCNLTLEDGGTYEIIKATAVSGFVVTIVRAQESTSNSAFATGATVSLRATADSIDTKQDSLSSASLTAVTVATGDKVLIQDVSDSNNLKTVTAQSIADLASVGSTSVLQTGTSAGNAATLKAYDVDGAAYTTFGTLTANNTPTFDLSTSVTMGGVEITHVGGTDVLAADGGTGRSSHTAYAVICGGTTTTGAQQSVASVGTSGQALVSNGAGALPTFQTLAGTGDVVGPGSATDNGFARFDGTTGKLIQNTATNSSLSDAGLASFGSYLLLEASNIRIWSGSTVVTTSLGLGALSLNAQQAGGTQNTGCGYSSLRLLTTGSRNTAVGQTALDKVVSNDDNSAFGQGAFLGATGSNGVAVGSSALSSVTSGSQNVGMGVQVGTANATGAAALTTGTNNTLLGYRAGVSNASTLGTIAIGSDAVAIKSTGSTSGTDGPGIAIGSAAWPVGFRGDGTVYSAVGASAGYWQVSINGTAYKIQLFAVS